ncbi:hypothetical protein RCC89_03495 [Cytophagaceae bacterium ABcell3]|nr:hypothetical protein RCC89_03495 [Cytophagaceae bacterium ABcell3]
MLGVPTVTDRWLQQAVGRQLAAKFELDFEESSYGFRPKKNLHQAVCKALKYRAEREENFLWKFLARSQPAGGGACSKERKLGKPETRTQMAHQKDQPVQSGKPVTKA